jgi:diguanylate cyclase (GGDEF)-like protein
MIEFMPQQITLAALEQMIGIGETKLPPAFKAVMERDRADLLASASRRLVIRSAVIYNLFLPLDFLVLPKTAWLSVALHFGIVTPAILLAGLLAQRHPGTWWRNIAGALVPVLMAAQIMLIFRLNSGPAPAPYQFLAVLVMVYTNINQALPMRVAWATSAAVVALYLGALLTSAVPEAVKITGAAMMLSAMHLSLEAKTRLAKTDVHQFLGRLRDRLQRFEAENEANRDALTGLSNRRHFEERTAALWAAAAAAPAEPVAIIMIDIDHFKLFNDVYGHPAGDHCIKRVAGTIAAALRQPDDLAVRFGGEEFVLLLPNTLPETAIQISERVRRAVEAMAIPHDTSPTGAVVTASLGVAASPVSTPLEMLVAAADGALYRAKRAGRNQVYPPLITLETGHGWRTAG